MSQTIRLTEDQVHEVKRAMQQRLEYLRSIDLDQAPIKSAQVVREAKADCQAVYAALSEGVPS